MKKVIIETHCHSLYSHDSSLTIEKIAMAAKNNGLTHILICDHDNYGKTENDRILLKQYGVELIEGIEFTTTEGIHVIGVHKDITKLQAPAYTYKIIDLVNQLICFSALIIIPHPYHQTGLIGNGNVDKSVIDFCLKNSNFLEISNYKYGSNKALKLLSNYPHLQTLIGSDAHAFNMVASQYNEFEVPNEEFDVLRYAYVHMVKIRYVYRKKHSFIYWHLKAIKKSGLYQFFLKLFPISLRKDIKNKLFNN